MIDCSIMVQTAKGDPKAKLAFKGVNTPIAKDISCTMKDQEADSCTLDHQRSVRNHGTNSSWFKNCLFLLASFASVALASSPDKRRQSKVQNTENLFGIIEKKASHLNGVTFEADADVGLDGLQPETNSKDDKKLTGKSFETVDGNPSLGTDSTGVSPAILTNQAIVFYKATGQGSSIWYALNIRGHQFAILEVNGQYPARIVNPNGVIVDVHTQKEKEYPQHKNIWATVTTKDGSYFLIPTALWNTMRESQTSDSQFSLPVSAQNGRTLIANKVAFGEVLKDRVISISQSSIVDDFLTMLSSEGTVVKDCILTSARGYMKTQIQSYTAKGQFDTYRVCIYCLIHDVESHKNPLLGDAEMNSDVNLDEVESSENLEKTFWERQHDVARVVFVEDSTNQAQSILVPLYDGSYYRLSDTQINQIFELCDQGTLDRDLWFKEVTEEQVKGSGTMSPSVIFNDKIFKLNLNAARDFFYSHPSDLFNDLKEDERARDLHRLVISHDDLGRWFEEGKTLPGLFLKETSTSISGGWPFVQRVEDSVHVIYYLNAKLVKSVLAVEPTDSSNTIDQSMAHFITSRKFDVHFETPETPRSEQIIQEATSWVQISHKQKLRFISESDIHRIHSLGVENLFVHKRLLSQISEGHLVKIGDDELVFDVGLMKELVEVNNYESESVLNTLRHFLGEESSSNQGTQRTIQYNLQSYFTGICDGKFVNESICLGTFKGDYHHCTDPSAKYPCAEITTPFECVGKLVRKGCYGDLRLKVRLNHTDFNLVTTDFSPLALDQCGYNTTLERTTPTSTISIECSKNYHIQAQKCVGANVSKLETLDNGKTKVRTRIHCTGTLDMNTLECASSAMSTFQCHEPVKQNNPDLCGDDFVHRTCAAGGDFDGCFIYNPSDEEVICQGGVYDGTTCKANKFYIEVDDNNYFISSICTGKYVKGTSCQGRFAGKVLSCPLRTGNETGICNEEDAIGPITCDGLLNKEGCTGNFQGVILINDNMNFSVDTTNTKSDFKEFKDGIARLSFLDYTVDQAQEDRNWNDIAVECKGGFYGKSQCKDANFVGNYRAANGWNLHSVRCHEVFDFSTFECLSGNAEVSHCLTEEENSELPLCKGSFKKSTCTKGSTLFACKADDQDTAVVDCKKATWDGSKCLGKELIIPVTNKRYITGHCTGDYVEHQSCDGSFKGGYVNCPVSYLTADITCVRESVDDFTCEGRVDKFGCHGTYLGFVHARGDTIRVSSGKQALAGSLGIVNGSEVYLAFINNTEHSSSKVKLGVDRELSGICHHKFNSIKKECEHAELNITNDYTPNTTYIRLTCHGTLNLDTLSCKGGLLSLYSCNGSQTFPDENRCLGIYHHQDCKSGGNATACYDKAASDVAVYCDGAYKDGVCNPFVVPQLPIIMINESYYVKGSCSSRITDNECTGIFTGSSVVNCSNSSALTVQKVFDACKPLPNEDFGTCVGVMNKHGCHGEYKISLEINSSTWDFSSEDSSYFNTVVVQGKSKLIKRSRGADDKTYAALACQDTFNMKTLSCNKTILQFIDKSFSEKGPGIAQTISAVCTNGQFDLRQLSCHSGEYLYYDCVGKSHKMLDKDTGITFTCLGDLKFSRCATGGQRNKCSNTGEHDYSKECLNSFFDGKICLKDKEPENTELRITSLGPIKKVDSDGQEVTIESFSVDKFHMYGATASLINLTENVLDKIVLLNGTKKEDGSVENIEMDQTPTKLSLDEGALHKITFQEFSLDELPYRDFAVNDDAQFLRILFKNMIIHQFMFNNLTSDGSVIRKLVVNDHTELKNYGVNHLDVSMGYGVIQLRDVELYLPYIKNSTMDAWLSDENNKIDESFNLPTVEDVNISPFTLRLQKEKKKIFLEFPQLSIEERSLDIIKLDDYLLASTSFTSDPVAAETVIRNYEQFLREHPEEQADAYEFSNGLNDESEKSKKAQSQTKEASNKKDSEPKKASSSEEKQGSTQV